jgi:methylenetetrahydrofolate reductase (NADPH)
MTRSASNIPFRDLLSGNRFPYGVEVVSSRRLETADMTGGLASFAQSLLANPQVGWISITDNPGGGPMLPPDWLANLVADRRERVVIHLTCKDINRSGLESAAWRYASQGFDNLLALTGDYPTGGFGGRAAAVFDLESLGLISLLSAMNRGLEAPGRNGHMDRLAKTDFFIGCAVSPFKLHERELMPQYFKLLRKIRAGARWVVTQLGYDMRKFHEVKLFLTSRGVEVPIVGNVYRLTRGIAGLFHSGKLAGCVVTDRLMEQVEKYAAGPDKGRKFFTELAAKQLAAFKGLGFAAGYLGGITKPEMLTEIIELAESYSPDDWRLFMGEIQFSQPGEFFLFEHDPSTGLSDPERVNKEYLRTLRTSAKPAEVTLWYQFSRKVHEWAFTRDKGLYGLMRQMFRRLDKKPGSLSALAYHVERASKQLGYGCQDCGDCSLPDCAYLCPIAGCSKGSRNGPCGGSAGGRCEMLDKECFWTRVYERMKYYGTAELMAEGPAVICDSRLRHTSSWANTYLDRDHHSIAGTPKKTAAGPSTPATEPLSPSPFTKGSRRHGD